MGTKHLWEKLQALQCHFTWCRELSDEVDAVHILQTLAPKVQHTAYQNRSIYMALKAYLQQLQGTSMEALGSLEEAEAVLQKEHPTDFSHQLLLIYGNYAWIYYRLVNYEMVELYLGRIHAICRSLSSPEPYCAQSPEIHAQKGWFLLALGFRNGEEAKKCFQMALREDGSNQVFQAGLALSVFASWTRFWRADIWKEAKSLMEQVLCSQPQNYEVKVHLANLIKAHDWERSKALTMEVVQNSPNPEDLRNAARVYKKSLISQAIRILEEAIALDPSYHLLHHDLGTCYMNKLEEAALEEREEILAAAIDSFKRAVEMDPLSVFSRLALAQLYSEKSPLYAEEVFQNLLEELPRASKRCQQAIHLHWGDFLLHKKGLKQEALGAYEAGYLTLGGHGKERTQLREKLMQLAKMFEEDSEMSQAEAVFEILRHRPEFSKKL